MFCITRVRKGDKRVLKTGREGRTYGIDVPALPLPCPGCRNLQTISSACDLLLEIFIFRGHEIQQRQAAFLLLGTVPE